MSGATSASLHRTRTARVRAWSAPGRQRLPLHLAVGEPAELATAVAEPIIEDAAMHGSTLRRSSAPAAYWAAADRPEAQGLASPHSLHLSGRPPAAAAGAAATLVATSSRSVAGLRGTAWPRRRRPGAVSPPDHRLHHVPALPVALPACRRRRERARHGKQPRASVRPARDTVAELSGPGGSGGCAAPCATSARYR